jgi:hypothetical protein
MINKPNSGVYVSRELLERIVNAMRPYPDDFDGELELIDLLAQPADQQGEPIGYIAKAVLEELRNGFHVPATICSGTKSRTNRHPGPDASWDVPIYAQPATAKAVLPERKPKSYSTSVGLIPYHEGWNACLDEVAKLNGGER